MDMPSPARDKSSEAHCSHVGALNGAAALPAEDSTAGAPPRPWAWVALGRAWPARPFCAWLACTRPAEARPLWARPLWARPLWARSACLVPPRLPELSGPERVAVPPLFLWPDVGRFRFWLAIRGE